MNAPVRRQLTIPPRQFPARAHWRVNGDHQLEVNLGGPNDLLLSAGEVDRLVAAIAAFKTEMTVEDGRTLDRQHDACKPLGVF